MLLATTDSDEVNLIACMIAKNLNPALIKVARLRNEEYVRELPLLDKDHLGIDHVINPQCEMVRNIQRLMEVPGASEVIDFVDGRVKLIGVTVDENSPFAGRKLLSFTKDEGEILVGAIVRTRPNSPDRVIIPHGDDSILADDLVYLVAREPGPGTYPRPLRHQGKESETGDHHRCGANGAGPCQGNGPGQGQYQNHRKG